MNLNGVQVPQHFNGIGLHDTPGAWTADWGYAQSYQHGLELRARGVTLYKLFASGANKVERARGYVDAGLVVIVRMYVPQPWGWPILLAPLDQVAPYTDVGVHLIEQTNEFNIACEWRDGQIPGNAPAIAERVVTAWESLLGQQATKPGLHCLFPSNTPGGNVDHRWCYQAIRAELESRGLADTVKHVAIHPRPLNNPPDTPWSQTNTCTFDEWRWIRDTLAPTAYYWATEHGYSLGDAQNGGYPPIDLGRHTDYNWELAIRLNPAHAQAIGPQFAGYCHWFHAGWGHWGAWAKDAVEDSPAPEMPAPSPLWQRMANEAGALAFQRYPDAPPPPPPPPAPAHQVWHLEDSLPWHPSLPRWQRRLVSTVNRIVVHHSAVTPAGDSEAYIRGHIEAINRYHIEHNGWPRIGYHYCIDGVGRIWKTNRQVHISYHAGNWQVNSKSFGICLLGDFRDPDDIPTAAALDSLHWLRAVLGQAAIGHYDVVPTQCPGPWWEIWREIINSAYDPDPEPEPPPPAGITFIWQPVGSLILLRGNHPEPGAIVRLSNAPAGGGYVWQNVAGHKPEFGAGGYEFSVPEPGEYWLEHQGAWYEVTLPVGVTTAVYG